MGHEQTVNEIRSRLAQGQEVAVISNRNGARYTLGPYLNCGMFILRPLPGGLLASTVFNDRDEAATTVGRLIHQGLYTLENR